MGRFSKQMKNKITGIINDMADHAELFSENHGHDFTRERSLNFRTMVSLIMSIGGNSLTKELYDFAKNGGKEVTPSAFVQQRDKISDEAFAYLRWTELYVHIAAMILTTSICLTLETASISIMSMLFIIS
ncbi:hypothetical protein SG0102_15770 [Intestinibaculum porci]|uniref:Tn3 transposase DDE domain-containing protein n=1 Tax=Intestinibaculum porci TaxID=2487118 RepID=A0A3G9JNR3_9FIRM|nr:hypothetical protein [Intestinibaculum porci]BBH26643.1 hypothetical protein SG0102_15770 [Intestinibaculum porci]